MRQGLADCQQLHRTVMAAYPQSGESARAAFGVLHRLEMSPQGQAVLYVQSRIEPDWTRLTPGYLVSHACKPVGELYAAIGPGMVLRFRLRANPTKRAKGKPEDEGRPGPRVELWREQDQLDWLQRKAEVSGFELVHVSAARGVPDVRGRHPGGKLTFGDVLFEGQLRVSDADRFRLALASGIGSAKAYGFGLLSVARA